MTRLVLCGTALAIAVGLASPASAVGTPSIDRPSGFYLSGMEPDRAAAPSATRPAFVMPEPGLLIDSKTLLKIRLPGKQE